MRNFNLEIAIPGLFWRNTKKGVEDELRLPPQHKETYFTHFTSIEVNDPRNRVDNVRS